MSLGLGPGIDYAAVGEALAMGEAIRSWADACDRANAQIDLANQIIARKNDETEHLAAEAAGLRQRLARAEVVAAQLPATQSALGDARRRVDNLEGSCTAFQNGIRVLKAGHEATETSLRRDLHVSCINAAGLHAMAGALVDALTQAVPEHPLLTPNGEMGADGEPRTAIDPLYDQAVTRMAARLGFPIDPQDVMEAAGEAGMRAIHDAAERRRLAAIPKIELAEKKVFE